MIHNNQEWDKDYHIIHIQTGMKERHTPNQLLAPAQTEPVNHESPKRKRKREIQSNLGGNK